MPVSILSMADFDAPARVDMASLTFGRTGDEPSLRSCIARPQDTNGDGLPDIVCHFFTELSGFQAGDTEGFLKGKTVENRAITEQDSIQIVPF